MVPVMRLVLDSDPRIHLVRSYGGGEIVIAEQRFARPLIVTPQRLIADWSATSLPELAEAQLQALFDLGAGIVLLGAGEAQTFASPAVRASFRARNIALECMTLGAACRTYNILANEERPVAAALFP